MTLWRLEWLRLLRTYRVIILPGLFLLSAILGPVLARYLPDLMESVGQGVEITLPEPTPYEGILQYVQNVDQLGLLGVAIFAAMSVAFDGKREFAVFLRSRASIPKILAPRLVAVYALSLVSLTVGGALALILTNALLGPPPVGEVIVGAFLYACWLGFVIALVTVVASFIRSVLVTSLVSIGIIILMGILTLVPQVGDWLPAELAGATIALMDGGGFVYVPPLLVATAVSIGFIWLAIHRLEAREV
ncbi:MAG: hypothetical protein R2823_06180 [Acidimicrobiia bacterium]